MTPREDVAILRRVLESFHAEQVRMSSVVPGPTGTMMVARITPTEFTIAMNALVALDEAVQS